MKRNIILLALLLSCVNIAFTQQLAESEIYTKVFVKDGTLLANATTQADGYTYLYVGKDEVVRKMVQSYNYPDSQHYIASTYTNKGQLQRLQFAITQPEGYSIWGYCERKTDQAGKPSDSIYYDYNIQSMDDYIFDNVRKHSTEYLKLPEVNTKQFACQDSLRAYLGIDNLVVPSNAPKVRTRAPIKGDVTDICANISFMEGTGDTRSLIVTLTVGTQIGIEEVMDDNWYKIRLINNYNDGSDKKTFDVHTDYIEAVEEQI